VPGGRAQARVGVVTSRLVVVGASLAGLRAVQAARRAGHEGPIILIGSEEHLPYDRPPLSKAYLGATGTPDHFVTEQDLAALEVDLRLGCTAESLDPGRKVVVAAGVDIAYDSLVVATGASPRSAPGIPDLDGIVTLRTLDDANDIRRRLRAGIEVVVVGAGFIGSEIASSVAGRGIGVTLLDAAPVPLVRAVGETVGAALARLHGRNGVRLIQGARIVEVGSGRGRVTGVMLATGEWIPADLVVVGVGAAPATAWLGGSGVGLHPADGGLLCDEYLETSVADVYGAGDVTHWPNATFDVTMRLENWTNAADQGGRAGANAVVSRQARTAYSTVPYFWSDWYGSRIQFVGYAAADDVDFVEGGPDEGRFVAFYTSGERLVGVATLNQPRKIMKFRRLIRDRATVTDAKALLASLARPAAGLRAGA